MYRRLPVSPVSRKRAHVRGPRARRWDRNRLRRVDSPPELSEDDEDCSVDPSEELSDDEGCSTRSGKLSSSRRSRHTARPKSRSLKEPSAAMPKFSGLRSRCRTQWPAIALPECKYSRAAAISSTSFNRRNEGHSSTTSLRTCLHAAAPPPDDVGVKSFKRRAHRTVRGTHSSMAQGVRRTVSVEMPTSLQMCWCLIRESMLTSRWKARISSSRLAKAGFNVLRA
mmetsp:Transcript_4539/g.14209  ORF Transcript_4539/g.14209 Transcript_4539/m.14209 type:complete len:225 (-) Transcript_4539:725-1399(-)